MPGAKRQRGRGGSSLVLSFSRGPGSAFPETPLLGGNSLKEVGAGLQSGGGHGEVLARPSLSPQPLWTR